MHSSDIGIIRVRNSAQAAHVRARHCRAWKGTVTYFDPGSVVWELESTSKFDAIREIIYKSPVFTEHSGLDLDEFCRIVIEREKLQSTGLGHGVAIAHGRTEQVSAPRVALGVCRAGLDFDSVDGKPVRLLFIVANHPSQQMDYLQILSALVATVRNKPFRRELMNCSQLKEFQEILCHAFRREFERVRLSVAG